MPPCKSGEWLKSTSKRSDHAVMFEKAPLIIATGHFPVMQAGEMTNLRVR